MSSPFELEYDRYLSGASNDKALMDPVVQSCLDLALRANFPTLENIWNIVFLDQDGQEVGEFLQKLRSVLQAVENQTELKALFDNATTYLVLYGDEGKIQLDQKQLSNKLYPILKLLDNLEIVKESLGFIRLRQ